MVKRELIADRLREIIVDLCDELQTAGDAIEILESKTNDRSDYPSFLRDKANDYIGKLYK